ncbi:MAG: phytanoyl-CoA dioxygenase family protein [Sphingomonas sp.]|uniref:phytanoyl-CoA dioxygenase family protein n=1 Tax=Sphingomonas sp. TaxID=28214 RepID=UPI0025D823C7|nr:phytanoyl-CoA dioxygenase family protein [Sphingomonas sp.]MBX3563601.1 phytanoyl-CoA dioxygenase family protein [Sphingomonas sp.]
MTNATDWTARLAADGYAIIPEVIDRDTITSLASDLAPIFDATPACEGDFYGRRTKRFGRLLLRSAQTQALVRHPLMLQIIDATLRPWCDRFDLNLTQGVEIGPGALAQYPHRDQDMWGGAKGEIEYLVNVIWPLTRFTEANGATVIWPGSHRRQAEASLPLEDAVAAEMQPGDALLFLGSTLHGGGANRTRLVRRGIIISYSLGWLKPFENPWLAYPPEVARDFDPELAALAGYAIHRPNLGNFEGQSPAVLLGDDLPAHLAAVDALRSDQTAALGDYVAGQTGEAARENGSV